MAVPTLVSFLFGVNMLQLLGLWAIVSTFLNGTPVVYSKTVPLKYVSEPSGLWVRSSALTCILYKEFNTGDPSELNFSFGNSSGFGILCPLAVTHARFLFCAGVCGVVGFGCWAVVCALPPPLVLGLLPLPYCPSQLWSPMSLLCFL